MQKPVNAFINKRSCKNRDVHKRVYTVGRMRTFITTLLSSSLLCCCWQMRTHYDKQTSVILNDAMPTVVLSLHKLKCCLLFCTYRCHPQNKNYNGTHWNNYKMLSQYGHRRETLRNQYQKFLSILLIKWQCHRTAVPMLPQRW